MNQTKELINLYKSVRKLIIHKFVKKHGYAYTGSTGEICSFIDEYFFNFDDIVYDLDTEQKKGLIFKCQDENLEYNVGKETPKYINFKSYSKGLRHSMLQENVKQ